MKYKKYPLYKETNIQWIKEIPQHWSIFRIGQIGKISTSSVDKKSEPGEREVKLLNYVDVYNSKKKIINNNLNYMVVTAKETQIFSNNLLKGDVVFTPSSETEDDIGHSAVIFEDLKKTLHSYHLLRLRFNNNVTLSLNYKRYLFNNYFVLSQFSSKCVGTTRAILGLNGFKETICFIPSESEQNKITSLLDLKVNNINETIQKDKELIKLLKERRMSLINHVVTKGLDKNAKMKTSGIDWIGNIPEKWEVRRIDKLSTVSRGASPRPIDDPIYFDDEGEYSWVRIADVTASSRYLEESSEKLSVLGKSLSVPLEPGRLFVSIAGTVGKPIITKIKCCIHDGFVYFKNLKIHNEYLYYIFIGGQAYLGLGKWGTQLNLNTETIGLISIPLPSKTEQEQIVNYLDKETSKIDNIIKKIEEKIILMEDYKRSLIYHVVTGKVDVRGVEI